jgi:tetratricopeptide (TPR) repeat protein
MTMVVRGLCLLIWITASSLAAKCGARAWPGTFSLPSYDEGLPDPNPPFDQLATNRFNYPYTLRTHLTERRRNHDWRAVFLENEYLKCTILPDLGGHLYTCLDKINGQPMFYANPSIKKANIGYRGAWAAFGIEYNFPVSHNWVSVSPIDYAFAQHADGSASVTVGNTDRVYGLQWSVEMRLRPNSTLLEQRVTLANPSDVRHRFYWWNNAAVEVWDDSQIQYPMRFAASHGFREVESWPIDSSGRDLSIIRNQTSGPVSLFAHGSREPFDGIWNPHTNSGTVHYAEYDSVPGKKIWSWGADADALAWRKALSDDDSAYVELQSGLFRNQETYAFLEPRQTIRFSEYWMPVGDLGGITRASLSGVLNLKRAAGGLIIGFSPNQPIENASIAVLDEATRVISSQTANLDPERIWWRNVPLPDAARNYTVEIRDAHRTLLLRQTEGVYDWSPTSEITLGPQPALEFPPAERRRDGDWIRMGEEQERNGKLFAALESYRELLKKFPSSYLGLKAAGRLSAALGHCDDGVQFLKAASAQNTTDAEVSYYLGLAYDGQGEQRKSREAFEAAYRLPQWRAAAALKLAEFSAREQDFKQAERYLGEGLRLAPDDLRLGEELVAVEEALGKEPEARALAQSWLERFPLSHFLRPQVSDAQELSNDDHRILNIAAEYLRLGLTRKAFEVLARQYPSPLPDASEPGVPAPTRDPMMAYFRAYCRQKLGMSSAEDYRVASTLPTDYVFPSGDIEPTVLRAAVETSAKDANARYLLGMLYFSQGLADRALEFWRQAQKLNPQIPVLDASMGWALLHAQNDPEQALAAFTRGIPNDSRNPAVYLGADQSLSILHRESRERVQLLELYPDLSTMPSELVFELAMNLAEAGEFVRATSLFRNRFFPREEGGTDVRQVWVEVLLQRARSRQAAGNCDQALALANTLGSSQPDMPFTTDGLTEFVASARTSYFLGTIQAACQKTDAAHRRFEAATRRLGAGEIVWAWLAAKELPGFDSSRWMVQLESALKESDFMAESSTFAGWWVYNSAMLHRALGRETEAERAFRKSLLLPDGLLSYHLTREALASNEGSSRPLDQASH